MAPQMLAFTLPVVKTLPECTDIASTVLPYYAQLQELPNRILEAGLSPEALKHVYIGTNPLVSGLALAIAISPIFLIVAEVNRNYSQVDRFWSILPTVHIAHYCVWAHLAGLPTAYLDALLVSGIIWSTRLTYNYWRKGGYEIGSEDYRWLIVQSYVHPVLFFLFDVVFIALAQNILLWMITTPLYVLTLATQKTGAHLTTIDLAFAAAIPLLVVFEWFADGQQWYFHVAKDAYKKTAKPPRGWTHSELDRGFLVRGLWAWSRHPNFAAEQTVWTVPFLWSCYVTGTIFNWTAIGPLSYMMLFQASTWLTELISSGKYPEYKEYQARVGKFYPSLSTWFNGPTALVDSKVSSEKKREIKAANANKKNG